MDDTGVDPEDCGPGLVDVADLPLRELLSSDDSALSTSLHRVIGQLDADQEVIAAFGNVPN